jgi:DNA mismatch endonuclease (patch repair protein)
MPRKTIYKREEPNRFYIRDGRAPIPEKESTSRVMSANRGKNTKPEIVLRKTMYANEMKGYRIHWKKVPGTPDIAFPGRKIAIFVNGCFWHRCPYCKLPLPKTNTRFWEEKFIKNTIRDSEKYQLLEENGWNVITIWECQILKDIKSCIEIIRSIFNQ